jgi:hypothetical protein
MEDKSKLGTVIDGIGASEHLDSSGEILSIKGMDISSLGSADSILNFEHNSKENPAQVCGKVTFAKKIFKKSDCDNERQEHFWELCKKPFVYVKGELFDHPDLDHDGARNIAALLRYDNRDKGKKTRRLISFSIEGGKLDKDGVMVKKSIARDLALTVKHCNKMCIVEILDDIKNRKDLYKNDFNDLRYRSVIIEDIKKSFPDLKQEYKEKIDNFKDTKSFKQKTDKTNEIGKLATKPISKPAEAKPKRQFDTAEAPSKLRVGDRITYEKKKARTGKQIYSDPDTWKSEKNNMRKALIAGVMSGSPDSKTGMAALASEDVDTTLQKPFKSKAQRRFAHANPEKFGGKKGIKEYEEDTPKNIPEKVKKNEKLEKMSQPSVSFPKMGVENKPEMQVKQIDPKKKFQTKSGKEFSQADIEDKKLANKYVQGQKKFAGARSLEEFDQESIDYINEQKTQYDKTIDPETTSGISVSDQEFGINEAYDWSGSQSKEKMVETKGRGNYPSTRHHEGLHRTLASLSSKTSGQHSKNLVRHLLDNFFDKNSVKGVSDYVSTLYDKDDPHLKEEHLTHILDLLTNRDKREDHELKFKDGLVGDVDYKKLKQGWKRAVDFTKNLDKKTLNKINDFYNKKDKNIS